MSNTPPNFPRTWQLPLKFAVVGALVVVLLWPVSLIERLIGERMGRRNEVVKELASRWGGEQSLLGPVLSMPGSSDGTWSTLPQRLVISGNVVVERRCRGIYEALLYATDLDLSGSFSPLVITGTADRRAEKGAELVLGISDGVGLASLVTGEINGQAVQSLPGLARAPGGGPGIRLPLPRDWNGGELSFRLHLRLQGCDRLVFLPAGEVMELHLASSWGSPSFDGAYLPSRRTLSNAGFSADWMILPYNREPTQSWRGALPASLVKSGFGVRFIPAVDLYQQCQRAVKYAALFIILSFAVFLLAELLLGCAIHPLQYLMIGFALTLFYSLQFALSEPLGFTAAYALASVAVVMLVGGYARTMLADSRAAMIIGLSLTLLYICLYLVLQLEDYALLAGNAVLFLLLMTVMYSTRNIHRANLEPDRTPTPATSADESVSLPDAAPTARPVTEHNSLPSD